MIHPNREAKTLMYIKPDEYGQQDKKSRVRRAVHFDVAYDQLERDIGRKDIG